LLCLSGKGLGAPATIGCFDTFAKIIREKYSTSADVVDRLKAFAEKNQLPLKVMEVGPPERRIQRLFVGLDVTKPELLKAYREEFQLEKKLTEHVAGVMPLEFQIEDGSGYVTTAMRRDANPDSPIYRWAQPDIKLRNWWNGWILTRQRGAEVTDPTEATISKLPILGYGHLIGLNQAELDNVLNNFLAHPEWRGPCKSANCSSWVSSIELGNTKAGASDDDRGYLFNLLGVARSSTHFEIGRRLTNAANERHGSIVVFLNGQSGVEAFNQDLAKHLPPDPQIPYANILRGSKEGLLGKDVVEAMNVIPDGANIFIPIAAGASPEGFAGIVERTKGLGNGTTIHLQVNGISESSMKEAVATLGEKLKLRALFLGSSMRALYRDGKIEVIPGYLGDFPRLMREKKPGFSYDAILVRVAPADANGHYSLGPSYDMVKTVIESNPGIKIIAEINPNIPRTTGSNFLTHDQITTSFKSNSQLAGPPVVPFTDVEQKIGENVAKLVPDNAYLQIGIGNVFDGIPVGLQSRNAKNLHISTEMFGDALKKIVELNMASSAETGFAYGSADLYRWLDNNPRVVFQPTEVVNNPARISSLPNFHAVNTALQVNLRGEVNATIAPDGQRISSPGGQVEFMSAGARSPGGKAIIAIRSTAKGGAISSISLNLYPGPITTPHESVTHVVTEYGTADLAGKTESERALALISIAHPKFRQQLINEAIASRLITEAQGKTVKLNP